MHIALVHICRSTKLLCPLGRLQPVLRILTSLSHPSVAFHVLAHVQARSKAAADALTTCQLCC